MRTQIKLGFITPFDHQRYVAGLDNNAQVYLPVNVNLDLDLVNAEARAQVKPINPDKQVTIVHGSVKPYTAVHDILQVSPIQSGSNTQPINARPVQQVSIIIINILNMI